MIILSLADEVLDAVEILVNNKVSGLQFNKTVRAKIAETMDASIGKYRVQYQNSYFTAYASDSDTNYSKGTEVYVEILSNDFEKNALIIGSVRRLGTNYINIIEELDKYVNVDKEIVINEAAIGLCSYKLGGDNVWIVSNDKKNKPLLELSQAQKESIIQAAEKSNAIKIGATIQTNLEKSQQINGNYGIRLVATYYDNAFITKSATIDRTYQFDINDMTGQPYKFGVPSNQYRIFIIDAKNFKEIKSITAFCEGFPTTSETTGSPTTPKDITLSNIHLQFLRALSEEELQTSSLSITAPEGGFFETNSSDSATKTLKADLRIKGKKVNYNAQPIDFYWFKQNLKIFSGMERFSPYGGNGWELLNTEVSLNTYEQKIKISDCPAYDNNKFKCVAVYTDSGTTVSLSDVIVIRNLTSKNKYNIISSTGTVFSFNTGKTVLTIKNGTDDLSSEYDYKYYWSQSVNGEAAVAVNNNSSTLNVNIATPAADIITYECSVFGREKEKTEYTLFGTASIDLFNNKETAGSTLVIKNGTQIFKYDEYGTAPTSESVAAADRMTIPYLSFDIYDKQGNLIDITNNNDDKLKYMTVKWIWPAVYNSKDTNSKLNTMLVPVTELKLITTPNIITGANVAAWGNSSSATFAYGIRDIYNSDLANTDAAMNNIRLEVDYQGEHLVASTNFTFTKEGELGTNGTKYVARIVPNGRNAVIIRDKTLTSINFNQNGVPTFTNHTGEINLNTLFSAQLWSGSGTTVSGTTVNWSIAESTKRSGIPRLTITGNNVKINTNGSVNSNILQATITYQNKKFYATYAIPYSTVSNSTTTLPWIQNGYTEVMYESDGTRGKFNGLPFRASKLTNTGIIAATNASLSTGNYPSNTSAGFSVAKKVDNTISDYTIEPPSYFISETYGHYIRVAIGTIYTYFPIQLYLNRYGMSAMNDWDGTGIQVNNNGGYILAPQVGAGRKNADNSFTGITIGEVFQNENNKEIGMFGYAEGARSLFLDAETGNAEFGVAGKGQIKIHASDGEGTIDSGDYYFDHTTDADGNYKGKGLKIKFTSTGTGNEIGPYIRYGSGNFQVDANGNLTARGGGTIAGWKIDDNNLYSSNKTIYLNSSTPALYGQSDSLKLHNSLTSTNNGFYLGPTGESIGSKFYVNNAGVMRIGAGAVANNGKHWIINGDDSHSYIRYGTRNQDNSVNISTDEITLGKKFYVDDTGVMRVGTGAVGNSGKHWTINGDDNSDSYIRYGTRDQNNSVNIATNEITLGKKFYVSNNGVMRIGTGAVGNTSGTKHWTIDGNNSNSYINYGTKGSTNSVYLGTDAITLGKEFYVSDTGVVRVGQGAVANTGKHWTITSNDADDRSYISYATSQKVNPITASNSTIGGSAKSVYLGTDGIRLGQKFAVDNDGNTKLNNLYANGSGQIGGWTIGLNTLTSNNNNITLHSAGSMIGPSNIWSIDQNGKATFTDIVLRNTTNKSNTINWNTSENERLFSLDDNGGYLGGWRLEPLAIYTTSTSTSEKITLPTGAQNSNLILSKEGAILGPKETNSKFTNFSPNSRIWEISNNGVAYFSDVHISNRNKVGNKFTWTGYLPSDTQQTNPIKIFELTDTGSNIGGWNITDTTLSSGIVNIDSSAAGSNTNSVISIGEALRIYGNGDINVSNITSGGSGSFNGSLSGTNCSFGSGTIGPANFGDVFNIPSGKMQFGGEVVTLNDLTAVTGLTLKISTVSIGANDRNIDGTISGDITGLSFTNGTIVNGSATIGGKSGSCSGSVSGSISNGSISNGKCTITLPRNLTVGISYSGTLATRSVKVMSTSDSWGGTSGTAPVVTEDA